MNKPYFFQMAVKEIAQEGEQVRIRGYASTPDLDRYRDIVEPEAFSKALSVFQKNPAMLRSHDSDRPVGEWDTFKVTPKGLWVEGVVKEKETAADVVNGLFKTLSIGYIPLVTELMVEKEDGTMRPFNWEEDSIWSSPVVRVIKELDLVEISIVSTPANPGALFTLAKSLQAFGKTLALKSFNTKLGEVKGEVPENEAKPGDEAPSEAPVDEDAPKEGSAEEGKEADTEGDKPAEEAPEASAEEAKTADEPEATPEVSAPAEGGTTNEDEAEAKSTDESQDDAENGDETSPADGAEGGEQPAEEAKADAEPENEAADEDSGESEGKAVIVAKAIADSFPELKASGAIREPEGDEKAEVVTKGTLHLMRKLINALAAENKRANDEQKRADDLKSKLDDTPEKKAISPHRQYGSEEAADKATNKSQTSEWFKSLFTPKT